MLRRASLPGVACENRLSSSTQADRLGTALDNLVFSKPLADRLASVDTWNGPCADSGVVFWIGLLHTSCVDFRGFPKSSPVLHTWRYVFRSLPGSPCVAYVVRRFSGLTPGTSTPANRLGTAFYNLLFLRPLAERLASIDNFLEGSLGLTLGSFLGPCVAYVVRQFPGPSWITLSPFRAPRPVGWGTPSETLYFRGPWPIDWRPWISAVASGADSGTVS